MANCSFIKATDARTRARNDTLIWTEICEIQEAILAAIDANQYSTTVADGTPFTETQAITAVEVTNGGTLYDTIAASGLTGTLNSVSYTNGIAANGTNGLNASVTPVVTNGVITDFTVNNSGSGYTPVSATASVDATYDLTTGQDETDFGGGRFSAGDEYFVGEIITLSESSTVLVNSISATGAVTIAAQTHANYDGIGANGDFNSGGSGYNVSDTITLVDGTIITVVAAPAGTVTQFTVTSSSTTSFTSGVSTLTQSSTSGVGVGFAITPDTNNETAVGSVVTFGTTASSNPFVLGTTLTQSSTTGIGSGFSIVPISPDNATANTHLGNTAVLTPIVSNGVITSVVVNNGGTLYAAGQKVTISHPSPTTTASATVASVNGSGVIEAVTVTVGGSGYETATALVAVDHPTGSGFVGVVTLGSVNLANNYTSGLAFANGANTITRVDGTGFVTDGLVNGQTITISSAEDSANNGTYTISNVTETVITVSETIAVTNAADTTAQISKPSGVTGISIQDGGFGYAEVFPTVTITDPGNPAGSGGAITITGITGGVIDSDGATLVSGGSGYSQTTTATVVPVTGDGDASGAVLTLTIGVNEFSSLNVTPTEVYSVWSGQSTNAVITDQIQYVLDYFDALGYNIRVQVNPSTANTIQWQIIW